MISLHAYTNILDVIIIKYLRIRLLHIVFYNFILIYLIGYLPGSKERKEIEAELKKLSNNVEDVPIVIGNEKIKTKDVRYQVMVRNYFNY